MNPSLLFIQVFLSVIFFVSSIAKWMDLRSFRETIHQLKIPMKLASAGAVTVPLMEMAAAFMLIWDSTRLFGCTLILLLLASFVWAAWNARGKYMDCNCFGNLAAEKFGIMTYMRIGVIFMMCLYLLLYKDRSLEIQPVWEDVSVALLSSIGILALYLLLVNLYKYNKVYR